MTGKQIENALNEFYPLNWDKMSEEQKQQYKELNCREMINAILIYDGVKGLYDKDGKINKYLQCYTDRFHRFAEMRFLGEKRVLELIEEQKEDFAKAKVYRNTYTDHEGVSYNSITWADEM